MQYYGVDLCDLGGERLTWRRLGVLIRQLPPTSATWLAKSGGESVWGLTEQLLAAAVDALNIANWQRAAAGRKKNEQPAQPEPITRPGVKKMGRRFGTSSLSIAEMRRRMERRNGRRR